MVLATVVYCSLNAVSDNILVKFSSTSVLNCDWQSLVTGMDGRMYPHSSEQN